MATVTLKGTEVHTNGNLPQMGETAPEFTLVDKDLNERSLSELPGKKILNIVPSLDTPVCAESTRRFNEYAQENPDATVLIISADLPFAQQRFCGNENLDNVVPLSMMRDKFFARDYGVLIEDGPLAGVTARGVLVLDEDNRVLHRQLVPEIAEEPDYRQALDALG